MKKAFVACVVLGSCTTFASAQDTEGTAARARVAGEPMGGHDIAVFTAEPSLSRGTEWPGARRHVYGSIDDIGPGPGSGGFTLGRQYNFEYLTLADVGDPLHAGTAGRASNLVYPSGRRVASSVG